MNEDLFIVVAAGDQLDGLRFAFSGDTVNQTVFFIDTP